MPDRTASPVREPSPEERLLDGPFRLVVGLVAVLVLGLLGRTIIGAAAPTMTSDPGLTGDVTAAVAAPIRYEPAVQAPDLELTDQDGAQFDLQGLRGQPVLVFFGYTHCADVCPATVGILGQVLAASEGRVRALFVTVDPERDTIAWLHEYVRYLEPGFSAATGSASEVRAAADAWGVRYARVEGEVAGEYSMAHTADVFLVDAAGRLVARFAFGTDASTILRVLDQLGASTTSPEPSAVPPTAPVRSPSPAPSTSDASIAELDVEVVSSAVWADEPSPLILRLSNDPGEPIADTATVSVQVMSTGRVPAGAPVRAILVRPPGVTVGSWVATVTIATSGWSGIAVTARTEDGLAAGAASVSVLDPGGTAVVGGPAPTARTPTLADVGGRALAVTTDPIPALRMSTISTADALAGGEPFVLVVDSVKFKVTAVCGTAVALAKYLLDRWTSMTFIHLEPYRYDVVTDTAVLAGSLGNPDIVPAAEAWGVAAPPWGAGSMPWVFVVDGRGIVRAKYQGIVGSADIDVILAMLEAGG